MFDALEKMFKNDKETDVSGSQCNMGVMLSVFHRMI